MQIADTLLLVFSQKLIPKRGDKGRILAYEKLTNSPRVANIIREGKTNTIKSLMQIVSEDMSSIEQRIADLCIEGKITFEDGLKFADNSALFRSLVETGQT